MAGVVVGITVVGVGCGAASSAPPDPPSPAAAQAAADCPRDPHHPSGWSDATRHSTTDALRICLYANDVRRPIKTALVRGTAAAAWVDRVMADAHEVASYECNDDGDRTVLAFVEGGDPVSVVLGNARCPSLEISSGSAKMLVLPPGLIASINDIGGPGPLMTVPGVVGERLSDAVSSVVKAGFLVASGPYPDPHRQYVAVAQSPAAGSRVHRTTVHLTLRALPRAPACTTAQVRVRFERQAADTTDDRGSLRYDVRVTNTSRRMCAVAGVPVLEFWSKDLTRLPMSVSAVSSPAAFVDLDPAGATLQWYREASVPASFRSGAGCGSSALHPAFVTVTTGAVSIRVVARFPRIGVCRTGASVLGFDAS